MPETPVLDSTIHHTEAGSGPAFVFLHGNPASSHMWRNVLPRIGRAVSRHDAAYSYLPESVGAFPWGDAFATLLRAQGFNNVTSRPLTFGSVYLYTAEKSRSVE